MHHGWTLHRLSPFSRREWSRTTCLHHGGSFWDILVITSRCCFLHPLHACLGNRAFCNLMNCSNSTLPRGFIDTSLLNCTPSNRMTHEETHIFSGAGLAVRGKLITARGPSEKEEAECEVAASALCGKPAACGERCWSVQSLCYFCLYGEHTVIWSELEGAVLTKEVCLSLRGKQSKIQYFNFSPFPNTFFVCTAM